MCAPRCRSTPARGTRPRASRRAHHPRCAGLMPPGVAPAAQITASSSLASMSRPFGEWQSARSPFVRQIVRSDTQDGGRPRPRGTALQPRRHVLRPARPRPARCRPRDPWRETNPNVPRSRFHLSRWSPRDDHRTGAARTPPSFRLRPRATAWWHSPASLDRR